MGPACCIHYVQLFKFAVAISTHITEIIKHCEVGLWGKCTELSEKDII